MSVEPYWPRPRTTAQKVVDEMARAEIGAEFSTRQLCALTGGRSHTLSILLTACLRHRIITRRALGPKSTLWRLTEAGWGKARGLASSAQEAPPVGPERDPDAAPTAVDDETLDELPPHPVDRAVVVRLRELIWDGSRVATGNPTLSLGLALDTAARVLQRREAPGLRFKTSEVEAAVAREIAALTIAAERAKTNLEELLATLEL